MTHISTCTGVLHDLSAEEIRFVREGLLEDLQQKEREHMGRHARNFALTGLFNGKGRHEEETDELMRYFELEVARARSVAAAREAVEVWRMAQEMGREEGWMAVRAAEEKQLKAVSRVEEWRSISSNASEG